MTAPIVVVSLIRCSYSWYGLYVDFALLVLEPVLGRGRLGLNAYEWWSTASRDLWSVPWTNLLRYIRHLVDCRFALLPGNVALEIKDDGTSVVFHRLQQRIHIDMQPPEIWLV